MSIYKTLIEKVEKGGSYRINLTSKSLRINERDYIVKGEVKVDDELILESDLIGFNVRDWKNMIWYLYNEFKVSVPGKSYKPKGYFKAKPYEELTLSEMALNEPRHLSRARLEGYILLGVLKGWLNWTEDDYWFWQCETDKDLVVLKEWF